MSYVRWSSPLGLTKPCGTCGRLDVSEYPGDEINRIMTCHQHQMDWARDHDSQLCNECTSGWYIYWDVSDTLAVWAAGAGEFPHYTYAEVCEIVETEDYARIPGYAEIGDQGVLAESLKAFVQDYQEEHKGSNDQG